MGSTIQSIRFNGEPVNFFDYVTYLFDSQDNINYSFQLELIISEVAAIKYEYEKEISVTIEYSNSYVRELLLKVEDITEVGNAEVPKIYLTKPEINPKDFNELRMVNWDTPMEEYPGLRDDILIEQIREFEMPSKVVEITANLPIDLAEWIEQNEHDDELLKEFLYMYKAKASE
ncbi:hypothetical protein [Cytobacillus pseudoceanisediminis]|uniref:hypothetical protein n=1 Tax=Cytobacillus pseudoceanisediminis TaxID=3051614 RepID=UPI0001F44AD3|nr:hypothetical protein HMPREF1013_04813 [Bacillus sp. 2_A_57_CT2]